MLAAPEARCISDLLFLVPLILLVILVYIKTEDGDVELKSEPESIDSDDDNDVRVFSILYVLFSC